MHEYLGGLVQLQEWNGEVSKAEHPAQGQRPLHSFEHRVVPARGRPPHDVSERPTACPAGERSGRPRCNEQKRQRDPLPPQQLTRSKAQEWRRQMLEEPPISELFVPAVDLVDGCSRE